MEQAGASPFLLSYAGIGHPTQTSLELVASVEETINRKQLLQHLSIVFSQWEFGLNPY